MNFEFKYSKHNKHNWRNYVSLLCVVEISNFSRFYSLLIWFTVRRANFAAFQYFFCSITYKFKYPKGNQS